MTVKNQQETLEANRAVNIQEMLSIEQGRENAFDLMYFSLTVSAVAFHYFSELRTDLNSYCL